MEASASIVESKDGSLVFTARFVADRPKRSDPDDIGALEAETAAELVPLPVVGKTYMVGVSEYVGPKMGRDQKPGLYFEEDNGTGWPGNSRPNIHRYHGWRGTTNDIHFEAKGVRKCLKASATGKRSKKVYIVFGDDLKKDFP